jgi:hypothetical protein
LAELRGGREDGGSGEQGKEGVSMRGTREEGEKNELEKLCQGPDALLDVLHRPDDPDPRSDGVGSASLVENVGEHCTGEKGEKERETEVSERTREKGKRTETHCS